MSTDLVYKMHPKTLTKKMSEHVRCYQQFLCLRSRPNVKTLKWNWNILKSFLNIRLGWLLIIPTIISRKMQSQEPCLSLPWERLMSYSSSSFGVSSSCCSLPTLHQLLLSFYRMKPVKEGFHWSLKMLHKLLSVLWVDWPSTWPFSIPGNGVSLVNNNSWILKRH